MVPDLSNYNFRMYFNRSRTGSIVSCMLRFKPLLQNADQCYTNIAYKCLHVKSYTSTFISYKDTFIKKIYIDGTAGLLV